MFHTILFDLDGTLINSLDLILECSRRVHNVLDIEWDRQKQLGMIGLPLTQIAVDLVGEANAENYIYIYNEHYWKIHDTTIHLYAGILELLDYLTQCKIKLGIVTSRKRHGTERSLETLGITHYFQTLVTADDVTIHKPKPEPVFQALRLLNSPSQGSLFVGDSPFDLIAGKAAGLKTCGVTWGASSESLLIEHSPDYLAYRAAELQVWLENQ